MSQKEIEAKTEVLIGKCDVLLSVIHEVSLIPKFANNAAQLMDQLLDERNQLKALREEVPA